MLKAYLDSNVFINGFNNPESNSRIILNLLTASSFSFKGIVGEYLLEEVKEFYEISNSRNRSNQVIFWIKNFNLEIIPSLKVKIQEKNFAPLITDPDDLPHITASLLENCDCFVTTNRKLSQMKAKQKINFITPKEFVEILGMTSINTKNEE